ncbi:ankyrin repeat domain-containing protein [Endozoicomonas sp. ONNA2]|uniref:ankyrin repeat domain-containing protein n=1 Tax=Endozoicomonas sp. ONNA2 TaxID=2828741 RepID=UPI002147AD76|nr:ankyrin repeat domain-containing protein [Endozoicomonas sp. ONNA2]
MYSSTGQPLSPGSANQEEAGGSFNTQPVPSLQNTIASAGNIPGRAISSSGNASSGNGSIKSSTSDFKLAYLASQLAEAVKYGDQTALVNLLDFLKKRKIDPNLCYQQGRYSLRWFDNDYSVYNILRVLLDRGIDPNMPTTDPDTDNNYIPLLQAATIGSYQISKALLEHGADPHARNHADWTALHLAVREVKEQSVMLMKCLVNHGADINARNDVGRTPLSIAVLHRELLAVNALLDEGADPNIPDNSGCTALDYAVSIGYTNMVDDLLAHGANPDTPGESGGWSNPLCDSLSRQHTAIADMLLSYGANPNKASKNGDIPLHLAIEKKDSACVDMLLAHGADPNIRNSSGQTAPEFAKVAKSPLRITNALSKPSKSGWLQISARNCIRSTLMQPQMTPKRTRAKPLLKQSKDLPLTAPMLKFVSNPLTL